MEPESVSKLELVCMTAGTICGAALGRLHGIPSVGAGLGALCGLIAGTAWEKPWIEEHQWLKERQFLFTSAAIPMAVAITVSLAFSFVIKDSWLQAVMIGVTVTWLGVLVTVFYVEYILQKSQERQWSFVEKEVGRVMHDIASSVFRHTLSILSKDASYQSLFKEIALTLVRENKDDSHAIYDRMTTDKKIIPSIVSIISRDSAVRADLSEKLNTLVNDMERTNWIYISRMKGETAKAILDYKDSIEGVTDSFYSLGLFETVRNTQGIISKDEDDAMSMYISQQISQILDDSIAVIDRTRIY